MSEDTTVAIRLHPATAVIGAIRRLPELVLGLPAVGYFAGDFPVGAVLLLAVLGFVIATVWAWVQWRRFTYWFADEQLVIESGVFSRNRRTIPYDRIQDVSLEQSLLARIFGVSIVRIETGSSGSDEGKLEFVSRAEGDRLRDTVRRHKAAAPAAMPDEEALEEAPAPVLFAMGAARIFVAGLFGFSLVFLAIIGVAFQYFGSVIADNFVDIDAWIGEDGAALWKVASLAWLFTAMAGLLVIGMITGVLRTFTREYGFVLTRTETGLRRVRGLFTRTDVVIPLRRIQAAIVSTGLIRRLFGWQELALQSLGGDVGGGAHHVAAPFAKYREIVPVLDEVDLPPPPAREEFRKVSGRLIYRSWLEDIPVILVIAAIASQFWVYIPWFLIPLLPILVIQPILQYRAHGYRWTGTVLFVRHRIMKPGVAILSSTKIQSVTLRRALTQRWFGTATLVIGLAGGKVTSPLRILDMEEAEARRLMAELLEAPRRAAFDL